MAGINLNSGFTEAKAGDITINVMEDVLIDGLGENIQTQTSIVNSIFENGQGNGGNITINARNIDFKNGGNIFISADQQGSLGNINLAATEDISFDGNQGSFRSGVSSFITDTGTGDVGNIEINSKNVFISNQGSLDTSTLAIPQPIKTSQGKIQPARGIKVKPDGGIVLTAYRTNNSGERIPVSELNCDRTY